TQQKGVTRADFMSFAKGRHASDLMIPSEVWVVDKLPLLGSGKVDMAGEAQHLADRYRATPGEIGRPNGYEAAAVPWRRVASAARQGEAGLLFRSLVLRLAAAVRPVVGRFFRALERLLGLEARRHRCVGAGEDLVVLDIERAQPALLTHGQGDKIADLDQFRL